MNRTLVGIDPGGSGGIAYQSDTGTLESIAMPETEGDIAALLLSIHQSSIDPKNAVAYIEQVGGFVGKKQPGSAMFKFGRNFGYLLGVLQTLGFRIELVTPQKWQKEFSLGVSNGNKTEWKNKIKAKAQQLFPSQKVTLKTADALLIFEYGKRRAL